MRLLTDMFASLLQNAFLLFKGYNDMPKNYDSRVFIEAFLKEVAEFANGPDAAEISDSDADAPVERNAHKRDWWVSGAGALFRMKGRDHWPQHATNTCYTKDDKTEQKFDLRRYCMYSRLCGRVLTYCTKCMVPLCLAHFESFHTHSADQFPHA